MDTRKERVLINHGKCPPCSGLTCLGACPQGILELTQNKKPQITDQSACTQCNICASLCPTKAITVHSTKPLQR